MSIERQRLHVEIYFPSFTCAGQEGYAGLGSGDVLERSELGSIWCVSRLSVPHLMI
jgi:hypothetical protein